MLRVWWAAGLALAIAAARADECDVLTARVVQATGATFDRRSPSGQNVFLKHPLTNEFSFGCEAPAEIGSRSVSLSVETAYPSAAFFDLVAKAGNATTGVGAVAIRTAAQKCHKAALRDPDEQGQIDTPQMQVDCQSFRRDSGGTSISVFPARK